MIEKIQAIRIALGLAPLQAAFYPYSESTLSAQLEDIDLWDNHITMIAPADLDKESFIGCIPAFFSASYTSIILFAESIYLLDAELKAELDNYIEAGNAIN